MLRHDEVGYVARGITPTGGGVGEGSCPCLAIVSTASQSPSALSRPEFGPTPALVLSFLAGALFWLAVALGLVVLL